MKSMLASFPNQLTAFPVRAEAALSSVRLVSDFSNRHLISYAIKIIKKCFIGKIFFKKGFLDKAEKGLDNLNNSKFY